MALSLTIYNLTAVPKTYLSGTVSLPASGSVVISAANQYSIAQDGGLRTDCVAGSVYLNAGGNINYASTDALAFLDNILLQNTRISGATDGTQIGNIGDRLKFIQYDSDNQELGTTANPLVTTATLSFAPELLNGRLFSASTEQVAASASVDNPLVLFRNPANSGKNYFIFKIVVGISTTNVAATFKLFGNPTFNTTAATITNITQTALSTTVTVTTSAAHQATVGAQVTISGTTNFNGTYTVTSVTSSTVYTYTATANVATITNTSGTSTVQSSLGSALPEYALKRVASPSVATGIATALPTLASNGSQLVAIAQGQNTTPPLLVDSAQISMEPGQAILITAIPNSNNRSTTVTIIWSEVPQ